MEGPSKVVDETVYPRGLGNSKSLSKETEKYNPEKGNFTKRSDTSLVNERDSKAPPTNAVVLEELGKETQGKIMNSSIESNSDFVKGSFDNNSNLGENSTQDLSLIMPKRREIFPKIDDKNRKIYELPEYNCALVEHSYCKMGKESVSEPHSEMGKSTCSDSQSGNTNGFENRLELVEKRMEQQKAVVKNSITIHVDSDSNLNDSNSIKERLEKRSGNKNTEGDITPSADSNDTHENNQPVRFLTPKICLRKTSKGSGGYYDITFKNDNSMAPPSLMPKSDSSELQISNKKAEEGNSGLKTKRKLDSPTNQITLGGISYKLAKMDKAAQSKIEALGKPGDKNAENLGSKNYEVPSTSRAGNLSCQENVSELQKEEGHVFLKPNLTQTASKNKNWNMKYMENDVKNLGLDDLLLRASELNAENFTKALGQNSGGRNTNKDDSPEIVLSFPSSKRESDDPLDGNNSNGGNPKKARLEFLQKCVKDDNVMKSIEGESSKNLPEAPKRPILKVKTVQNINEEYDGSLGAKLKKLEGRGVAPGNSFPLFTINDGPQRLNSGIFVVDGRDKIPQSQPTLLNRRKVNVQQDSLKPFSGITEQIRPFTMTIMQNKDNAAKDRMPAASTSKIFVKPGPVFPERGNFLSRVENRPIDSGIFRRPDGVGSGLKSGENVTVVLSGPRSFEMKNADGSPGSSVKKTGINSHFVLNCGSLPKKDLEGKNLVHASADSTPRMKTIPIILSNNKKYLQMPLANNQKLLISPAEDPNKAMPSGSSPQNEVANPFLGAASNIQKNNGSGEKTNNINSSVEQRPVPRDTGSGTSGGFIKVLPNLQVARNIIVREKISPPEEKISPPEEKISPPEEKISLPEEKTYSTVENVVTQPKETFMTLTAFADILKDILPEKWILYLDKKLGLQIIKTHLDDHLNPTMLISLCVGTSGRVTVNVRGRQLEESHCLFSSLCQIANSEQRVNINYVLGIINKLRFFSVCYGSDDLRLKKYWSDDGFIEYFTEYQQTYRSHICESLVRLGRKRCHPCFRMHEALKKRRRRELKAEEDDELNLNWDLYFSENMSYPQYSMSCNNPSKLTKRTEGFFEEIFSRMKDFITLEIRKAKETQGGERVPRTQDEVLGFMGLTRKDSLDVNVRKSKREKKGVKQQGGAMLATSVNLEELLFLDKHWQEITVLFTTSLLVGAYSRTGLARLKEKCITFYNILVTWRKIVRENAICVGGYFDLAENLMNGEELYDAQSVQEKFDAMDGPTLRAYIVRCVKEVNRMKNRLRSKSKYFRTLYDNYLKPNSKRGKQTAEPVASTSAVAGPSKENDSAGASNPQRFLRPWPEAGSSGSSGNNSHPICISSSSSDEE